MKNLFNPNDFCDYVFAQDDDNDYQESGWVCVIRDNSAALAWYSHCSCYGTWDSISEKDDWDWSGTTKELYDMALNAIDPIMPNRTISSSDYDHDHLQIVYQTIIDKLQPVMDDPESFLTHDDARFRLFAKEILGLK